MRMNELRECVVLAETLSFTETARRLYTTQSALSKHIQAMEQELDVKLFIRDQHGVSLTRAGQKFALEAAEVLRKYERAVVDANRLSNGIEDTITVGYLAGACFRFLPDALNTFASKRPDIEVELETMEIDGVVEGLERGSIDIGLAMEFVPFPTSRYRTLPIYEDYVAAIIPKHHRLAGQSILSIEDLAGETVLLANPSYMVREAPLLKNIILPVEDKITVKENVNDIMALFVSMRTEQYVTLFYAHSQNFADFKERFDFIPLKECPERFNVVAVWEKSSETRALVDFAESLREAVRAKS